MVVSLTSRRDLSAGVRHFRTEIKQPGTLSAIAGNPNSARIALLPGP